MDKQWQPPDEHRLLDLVEGANAGADGNKMNDNCWHNTLGERYDYE